MHWVVGSGPLAHNMGLQVCGCTRECGILHARQCRLKPQAPPSVLGALCLLQHLPCALQATPTPSRPPLLFWAHFVCCSTSPVPCGPPQPHPGPHPPCPARACIRPCPTYLCGVRPRFF